MMEHAKEEAITLLEGQPVLGEQHEGSRVVVQDLAQAHRKKALRALVGVIGAVVLVAGSIVAVEMMGDAKSADGASVGTMTLNTRGGSDATPSALESQFGWSSVKNGWCSTRANIWCLFKSNKEKCKKEIHENCDSKPENEPAPSGGSGSGSGSGLESGSGSGSGKPGPPEAGDPDKGSADSADETKDAARFTGDKGDDDSSIGKADETTAPETTGDEGGDSTDKTEEPTSTPTEGGEETTASETTDNGGAAMDTFGDSGN